ncbi:hypothetical protein [uncultured Jatrophihabitans sp.]|uniref:hypothetical protein n=1 Tax=uncultured Jatrophihabitans sp. TaxID=1610747 RepID=UPI0035CA5893
MSQTAVALLAVAALVSLVQWSWSVAVHHVDPRLIPACHRPHVRWLQAHTRGVQLASALVAISGVCLLAT